MSVHLRLLLTVVTCVWSTGLARSEDRSMSAPVMTAVAGGIDLRAPEAAAVSAVDGLLRIGATGSLSGGTQLWATPRTLGASSRIAPLIADAASRAGLPYDFLYRLLVRESGLRPDAVSPKGALGIAQFMPATALERGLADPFDPQAAVLKAAELLKDHWTRFGNLGLAAAAYNAGPGRVDRWLGGVAAMPLETRAYVRAITGREVESWSPPGRMAMAPLSAGSWVSQWTALLAPPDAPTRPHAATSDSFRRITARSVSSLGNPSKATSARSSAALVVRSETANTTERRVRSEQSLCNLMNERGQTCLVRQIY